MKYFEVRITADEYPVFFAFFTKMMREKLPAMPWNGKDLPAPIAASILNSISKHIVEITDKLLLRFGNRSIVVNEKGVPKCSDLFCDKEEVPDTFPEEWNRMAEGHDE